MYLCVRGICQESELSCICVLEVSMLPLFLRFCSVSDIFVFHFICLITRISRTVEEQPYCYILRKNKSK